MSCSGGGATQTSFERVRLSAEDGSRETNAYVLLLQIPVDSLEKDLGIKLVLKTPSQRWLGCSNHGLKEDFFLELVRVGPSTSVAPL